MKILNLKILKEYADAKVKGLKPFEIRKNDRDYQVGDLIRYKVIDENGNKIQHKLSETMWEILYISNYAQKDDYIVFTDKDTELPF